ncbi:unnamed protein product [Caenorhabditis auriculariae]|uniref:DUF8117 domain-containing protein n=1 Tax=Caenorhabditis auriculariae TaxID=2777116 RepID=A0A8S1H825_9PELO|nr:unnamed protein product [Caenorhabditis auriculariae]
MEDTQLFPKDNILNLEHVPSFENDFEAFSQMKTSLDRLWWSRLVISVRGYVINYVHSNDNTLFHCDDAFTIIHRYLAETSSDVDSAHKYFVAVGAMAKEKDLMQRLLAVAMKKPISDNPLDNEEFRTCFEQVFGKINQITIQISIEQLPAYIVFARVFSILQMRWKEEKAKRRGIRFETDPEWEPDERVVLFQQFGSGNRTWILLDFDRYILAQWKPNGTSVIFGDRFVEKKKRSGLKLCATCGMLEQQASQFYIHNDQAFLLERMFRLCCTTIPWPNSCPIARG